MVISDDLPSPSLDSQLLSPFEIHDIFSFLDSDSPPPENPASSTSAAAAAEDRRRRRMISNRESAKRSRIRKKQHAEDVVSEWNRLQVENRGLKNRLCAFDWHRRSARIDSESLVHESTRLRIRLDGLRRLLQHRAQQQSEFQPPPVFANKTPSLLNF